MASGKKPGGSEHQHKHAVSPPQFLPAFGLFFNMTRLFQFNMGPGATEALLHCNKGTQFFSS